MARVGLLRQRERERESGYLQADVSQLTRKITEVHTKHHV
jgi:hypothetical protein